VEKTKLESGKVGVERNKKIYKDFTFDFLKPVFFSCDEVTGRETFPVRGRTVIEKLAVL